MEQAAAPGGRGFPCNPEQALALYQHLFRCPAGPGQLQAALRQVREAGQCLRGDRRGPGFTLLPQGQEGWCPPAGLELPAVLLEMERNRQAQEQLLWDLELLCGAGLSLFWPPRVQFCGLRNQAQCAWSQCCRPGSRIGGSEWPKSGNSRLCPSPQAGDSLSQNHQLPEGTHRLPLRQPLQAVSASPALDLPEAGRDAAPQWQAGPGRRAEPTPGSQELNSTTSSSFGEPGSSEFKDFTQREENGQAEPEAQRPSPPPSRSPQGRKLSRGTPGPADLSSQDLPGPQDGPQVLGWRLDRERAELQKLLGMESPQRQREENLLETEDDNPQGQRTEAPQGETKAVSQRPREGTHQGQRWEAHREENRNSPQGPTGNCPQSPQKEAVLEGAGETPPGEEAARLQPAGGEVSHTWEVAQGAGPPQPGEASDPLRLPGGSRRPPGEQMPQPGGRESPSPEGGFPQRRQGQSPESAVDGRAQGPVLDGARAAFPPPTGPRPAPGSPRPMSSGQQERPAGLSGSPAPARDAEREAGEGRGRREGGSAWLRGALGEARGAAEAPRATKAAWAEPSGREEALAGASAARRESALQRLLELHGAARSRRREAREQQRLRVLERLHIARNRHCRVHPLEPPATPVQLPPQEDPAGQRRALREQLQRAHQERTRQLRALGARNTHNFQQLLWPEPPDRPAPGQ